MNFIFKLCYILIGTIFLVTLVVNTDKIPVHFDFSGNVTRMGNFKDVRNLIIVNVLLVTAIFILSKYPEKLNYPVEVNEENKAENYAKMITFLSIFSLLITSIFTLLIITSIFDLKKTRYLMMLILLTTNIGLPLLVYNLFISKSRKNKIKKI